MFTFGPPWKWSYPVLRDMLELLESPNFLDLPPPSTASHGMTITWESDQYIFSVTGKLCSATDIPVKIVGCMVMPLVPSPKGFSRLILKNDPGHLWWFQRSLCNYPEQCIACRRGSLGQIWSKLTRLCCNCLAKIFGTDSIVKFWLLEMIAENHLHDLTSIFKNNFIRLVCARKI